MKHILVVLVMLVFILPVRAQVTDTTIHTNTKQEQITTEAEVLKSEVQRLKTEKNQLMDDLAQRRLDMITLAALLTLSSLFMILFVFLFLRMRRRRRIDTEELQLELDSLKKLNGGI